MRECIINIVKSEKGKLKGVYNINKLKEENISLEKIFMEEDYGGDE